MTRSAAADGSRHLNYLDGVRGFSVLLVMLFHERVHLADHTLQPIDIIGAYGVDLFFVLSGCCLALPYLIRLREGGSREFDVVTYAARRILRIMPAFVAATVLLAAVTWIPAIHDRVPELGAVHPVAFGDVVASLAFFDRDLPLLNPSFWSLAIEWRWYALFPVALVLFARAPRVLVALAVAAAAWTFLLGGSASTDFGMLPAFLFGLVAADCIVKRNVIPARVGMALLSALSVALLLGRQFYFPVQVNPVWQFVAIAFLIFAGADPRARALLEMPWLCAVGRVAYSTYLIHEPIVRAVEAAAVPRYGDGVAMLLATAAALAAGFGLGHLIELPLQRRDVVARIVTAMKPRIARIFAFAGVPATFQIVRPGAREQASNLVELRARAALRAVS